MNKIILRILFVLFLCNAIFAQTIDINRSFVKFTVRNMSVRDVVGTISNMNGTVQFDSTNLDSSYFDVTIDLNTIDTKNEKRDKHLKNEDFFEIEKWPLIHFKSRIISKQDDILGVAGYLTIKDVTKEVFVPFTVEETESTIIFKGSEIIRRLEYNVGVDTDTFQIGDEINVEVICVVNKYD